MFGLGSQSQLGIGIAISLHDRFSGQAARVNQQLVAMRKNANSAVVGAMRDYRNNAATVAIGAGAVSLGLMNAAKQGADFQHAINQVFIVGGKELGRSREQLSDFAQNMSKEFTRTPTEISKALFENAKQGLREGIEEITRYQIAVSTATDEVLEGPQGVAANLLNIMNAMKLPTSDFPRISNAITAVANATQASVYDIGESMQYAAFTAHSFNIPLEATIGLIGKMAQVGIRGTSAGTALNNALTQMAKSLGPFQTKGQLQAWDMLGLDVEQMKNMANQGKFTDIIKAVGDATKDMGSIDKKSILTRVFNMRGTRGIEAMSDVFNSKGNKSVADIIRAAEQGVKDDIAMKQSKAMMNDLKGEFGFLANAIHRFKIAFANAATPVLRVLLSLAGKVINVFSAIMESPIGSVLAGLAVVVTPLIGIVFALRAAAFAATLALRSFAIAGGVGGLKGLLGAGLNLVGMGKMGSSGGKFGPPNPAGMRRVLAGQTLNVAGKTYKGGQILPKNFMTTLGITSGAAGAGGGFLSKLFGSSAAASTARATTTAATSVAGTAATGLGGGLLSRLFGTSAATSAAAGTTAAAGVRSAGLLGSIGGLLARAVPWIGGIWLATEALKLLGFNAEARESQPRQDPLLAGYYSALDAQMMGYNREPGYYGRGGSMYNERINQKPQQLNQNINVMVDGRSVIQQNINQDLDNTLNSDLDFSLVQ